MEITITRFPAQDEYLLIWLAPEYGFRKAHRWNVVTYPSTFVIYRQGKFRYVVNAAIEWDTPEPIQKLESLMN